MEIRSRRVIQLGQNYEQDTYIQGHRTRVIQRDILAYQEGTNDWKKSMIVLRLCWPIFALWYMWQGAKPQLLSTEVNGGYFEVENGVRQGSALAAHGAHSLAECALMCIKEKSCSDFNFGSGQCELLTGEYYDKNVAPGWTHGYYITGKQDRTLPSHQGNSSYKDNSAKEFKNLFILQKNS